MLAMLLVCQRGPCHRFLAESLTLLHHRRHVWVVSLALTLLFGIRSCFFSFALTRRKEQREAVRVHAQSMSHQSCWSNLGRRCKSFLLVVLPSFPTAGLLGLLLQWRKLQSILLRLIHLSLCCC
jgi:hypothetical protein